MLPCDARQNAAFAQKRRNNLGSQLNCLTLWRNFPHSHDSIVFYLPSQRVKALGVVTQNPTLVHRLRRAKWLPLQPFLWQGGKEKANSAGAECSGAAVDAILNENTMGIAVH